ncbi:hypothetical protein ACVNP1_09145 [Staphylococcus aureus]
MRYTKSEEAMKVAETLMPGGVNSPVRAFKSVDTPAIFMITVKVQKFMISMVTSISTMY